MQYMENPFFITITNANKDAAFITVVNHDTKQRHTFVVPASRADALVKRLSNGESGEYTLQDDYMHVHLVLDSNTPLYWLASDNTYNRFARRLAKPQTSIS